MKRPIKYILKVKRIKFNSLSLIGANTMKTPVATEPIGANQLDGFLGFAQGGSMMVRRHCQVADTRGIVTRLDSRNPSDPEKIASLKVMPMRLLEEPSNRVKRRTAGDSREDTCGRHLKHVCNL